MNSVDNGLPGIDLILGIKTGNVFITAGGRRNKSCLRDKQGAGGGGALRIVVNVKTIRNVARRAEAGQRGHDEAILKSDIANLDGLEKIRRVGHGNGGS